MRLWTRRRAAFTTLGCCTVRSHGRCPLVVLWHWGARFTFPRLSLLSLGLWMHEVLTELWRMVKAQWTGSYIFHHSLSLPFLSLQKWGIALQPASPTPSSKSPRRWHSPPARDQLDLCRCCTSPGLSPSSLNLWWKERMCGATSYKTTWNWKFSTAWLSTVCSRSWVVSRSQEFPRGFHGQIMARTVFTG